MVQVLVVIHLLIAFIMIALILLQKSEGAAGGGFSAAPTMGANQVRARPNPLSRATTVLGICFFATSLGLALVSKPRIASTSMFAPTVDGPAVPKIEDSALPAVPSTAPEAAAPSAPKAESSTPQVPNVPNN